MQFRREAAAVATAAMVILGLGACDPPGRAQLTVDSTALGADGNPGDGNCSAPTAGGACTLQAAVQEASAFGPSDIQVPSGSYVGAPTTLTVTGDVAISGDGVDATLLSDYQFVVASTGALRVTDVGSSSELTGPRFAVEGTLNLSRSVVSNFDTTITVAEGASVGIWSSLVTSSMPVLNQGDVAAYGSTLRLVHGRWGAQFTTGDSDWQATATAPWPATGGFGVTCDSSGLTSHGYNRTGWGCGLSATGDSSGLVLAEFEGSDLRQPVVTSPLVDAIPIGEAGCALDTVDLFGNPRGVDGNGDGIPGCDIGAVERQP